MSKMFRLVSLRVASCNTHLHQNLSRHTERSLLHISRVTVSIRSIPTTRKGGAQPTGDKDRHIKKCTVPGYDEEDLGDTPFASPDVLDFTIEEYQPVVYLVTDNRPIMNG